MIRTFPMLATLLSLWTLGTTADVHGQAATPTELLYDSAYFAWDAGDYPTALRQLQRLLTMPGADAFVARAAELTGEVYRSTELANDGRLLRWSANGRVVAFESGTAPDRVWHVFRVDGTQPRQIAEVAGYGLAISADGQRIAYLSPGTGGGLAAELAAVDARAQTDGLSNQERNRRRALIEGRHARLLVRDLEDGSEREWELPALAKLSVAFDADGDGLYVEAAPANQVDATDIHYLVPGGAPVPLTSGPGIKSNLRLVPGGRHLLYSIAATGGSGGGGGSFGLIDTQRNDAEVVVGSSPSFSANGSILVYVVPAGTSRTGAPELAVRDLAGDEPTVRTISTSLPPTNPVVSPDGRTIAYQAMPRDDWEIYTIGTAGQNETRITRDIQHDILPQWMGDDRLFAVVGEARHRRSFLYDLGTGEVVRLHHNNTIRTVAPEYEWSVSPDGSRVTIVADRDGDTISPERGVYLMDLNAPVTREEVLGRIETQLAAETRLRERGLAAFAPIAERVHAATSEVSTGRIYSYAHAVYQFDSKNITQPGNLKAIEYYERMLRSFGYEPEVQWFEPRPGIRSANIVATLRGTTNPDLIYVVSSHFDSVERGPGADDNSSGSTALLEAARVLANRPQPATIKFAWFTGEESGLLGSREFVRRAVANGDHIAGVLNNDMVGWSGNHRLDNTIRYSNDGIRDIQHAAAMQFSELITYDARYYRSTDAGAFYEVYGDIVGGIGSYPILSSPHYHQAHDILPNINQPLVAQVSKTTVATIMLLVSSPSRPTGLVATRRGSQVEARWDPAPEVGVQSWEVRVHAPDSDRIVGSQVVQQPAVTLQNVPPAATVTVRAIGPDRMFSWDIARTVVN